MAVGSKVARFKPGDEVFGGSNGSFAEYTVTTEDRLALKPARLDFRGGRDNARCQIIRSDPGTSSLLRRHASACIFLCR